MAIEVKVPDIGDFKDVPVIEVLVKAGDKVKAEVANIDSMDRRVTLTMRDPGGSAQAEQLQVLKREAGKGATLGDLLGAKLQGMTPSAAPAAPASGEDDA